MALLLVATELSECVYKQQWWNYYLWRATRWLPSLLSRRWHACCSSSERMFCCGWITVDCFPDDPLCRRVTSSILVLASLGFPAVSSSFRVAGVIEMISLMSSCLFGARTQRRRTPSGVSMPPCTWSEEGTGVPCSRGRCAWQMGGIFRWNISLHRRTSIRDTHRDQWTLIDIGHQIDLSQICYLAPFNKGLIVYGESITVGITFLQLK